MIRISKTPLRISFFGGGTDYPEYFKEHSGMVVGSSINLYIYIMALPMPDFCEHHYRILYRKNETVSDINHIQHPVIRAVLSEMDYAAPLNISIMSDVPGGTGLGSSSSFTVGFINLVNRLKNHHISKYTLAQMAIHIERNVLKENVGIQDQLHASFGGLSCYSFDDKNFSIRPIRITPECQQALDSSMFLIYTKQVRRATQVLDEQMENTKKGKVASDLAHLRELARQSVAVLEQQSPDNMLKELGAMLDEAWRTKRKLSSSITNAGIDELYEKARELGAYGGKLCGAGGGGFFLLLAPSHAYPSLAQTFGEGNVVRISTENYGSRVVTVDDDMEAGSN